MKGVSGSRQGVWKLGGASGLALGGVDRLVGESLCDSCWDTGGHVVGTGMQGGGGLVTDGHKGKAGRQAGRRAVARW